LLTELLGLKNASQFAVIWLTALELEPGFDADAVGGLDVPELLGLLPPQAVTVTARAMIAQLPRICGIRRSALIQLSSNDLSAYGIPLRTDLLALVGRLVSPGLTPVSC
jgi:hypothetical protein